MGIFVAFVLVLSFSGLTSAVDEKQIEKKARAKARQITGEIVDIDAKAKTVSVKGKNGTIALEVTDRTKVSMHKETKALEDVQVGDRVTVKFKESGGKQTAKSIEIKSTVKRPKLPT